MNTRIAIILTLILVLLTSKAVLAVSTSTPTSSVDVRTTEIINSNKIVADSNGLSIKIIRDNYSQAIQLYQQGKNAYFSLKQTLHAEQGTQVEQQLVVSGKQILIYSNQAIINYIDGLKNRIINSQVLTDKRVAATSMELAQQVDGFLQEKSALEQASSLSELKQKARAIKHKWAGVKLLSRLTKAEAISAKIRGLINKLDGYGGGINTQINQLDEQGIDTGPIKEKFVRLNEHLLQVKVFFNNAQSNFAQLQETGDLNYYSAGLNNLKQSRAMMKIVKKSLSQVIEELKRI